MAVFDNYAPVVIQALQAKSCFTGGLPDVQEEPVGGS